MLEKSVWRYSGQLHNLILLVQQDDEGDTPTQRVIILKEVGRWRVKIKTLEVAHPDFKKLAPKRFILEALGFAASEGYIKLEGPLTADNLEEIKA